MKSENIIRLAPAMPNPTHDPAAEPDAAGRVKPLNQLQASGDTTHEVLVIERTLTRPVRASDPRAEDAAVDSGARECAWAIDLAARSGVRRTNGRLAGQPELRRHSVVRKQVIPLHAAREPHQTLPNSA